MATKSAQTARAAEIEAYLVEHDLEALIKDVLTYLLTNRPARPLALVADALRVLQQRRDNGTPANVTDLLASLITAAPAVTAHAVQDEPPAATAAPATPVTAEVARTSLPDILNGSRDKLGDRLNVIDPGSKFNKGRRGSVSAESMKPTTEEPTRVIIPKSNEARLRIAAAISHNLLFRNLDRDQRQEVVDAMFERKVAAGETVIRQGDEGDNFYVVDSGLFDIYVKGVKVVEIGQGGSFGELALMYNTPRAATVTARVDSVVWAVDRVTFRRIVMNNTFRKRKMYEAFIQTVPILQSLDASEIVKVADACEPVRFDDEEVIIEQGDAGDSFYVIVDGEAVVTKTVTVEKDDGTTEEETVEVNRLRQGDYFGELSLLTDRPRAATVTAVGDVDCICLDTKAFIRLLGPCVEILKRNADNYKRYSNVLRQPTPVETPASS